MTAKKQSKEPETPRAPKCPPCLDDCERCDDRTPDNKCKCPRRDTSDGCKFYHKPAPKEPDRMTDERKAEIRRYAERWDRGAFKEYSELVCVLLDEIDALEAKVKELKARPTTYTEAHYYTDKLRYEARIAQLEAELKEYKRVRESNSEQISRYYDRIKELEAKLMALQTIDPSLEQDAPKEADICPVCGGFETLPTEFGPKRKCPNCNPQGGRQTVTDTLDACIEELIEAKARIKDLEAELLAVRRCAGCKTCNRNNTDKCEAPKEADKKPVDIELCPEDGYDSYLCKSCPNVNRCPKPPSQEKPGVAMLAVGTCAIINPKAKGTTSGPETTGAPVLIGTVGKDNIPVSCLTCYCGPVKKTNDGPGKPLRDCFICNVFSNWHPKPDDKKCPRCNGHGTIFIEMDYGLPVYDDCPDCKSKEADEDDG